MTDVVDFGDCALTEPGLDAFLDPPDRSLEIYLAKGVLSPVHTVQSWEELELIRDIRLHFGLLPHIHPAELHQVLVFHGRVFPELTKIVAVLTGRVDHLDDPELVGIAE